MAWDLAKTFAIHNSKTEYAIPISKINQQDVTLTSALLTRMSVFCREKSIICILADIPVHISETKYASSIEKLGKGVRDGFDYVLMTDQYLKKLGREQRVHVKHGQHHINEFTHRALAESLANIIIRKTNKRN